MNLSTAGANLIEQFEGFVPHPYRDSVGVWTIGYGSTKGVGPNTPNMTRQQAEDRLMHEVDQEYGAAVNALRLPLSQPQFDALVSFVYNVGTGGIATSTGVGRALRAHAWGRAADELLKWDKAGGRTLPGLTRRRHAEAALFRRPTPRPDPLADYRDDEVRWIREYDKLKRADPEASRLDVLRAVMTKRRKAIWTVAQHPGGWDKAHRRARYNSLLSRTRP